MSEKRCPYCYEKIQKNAIVCKHCKSRLLDDVNKTYENIDNNTVTSDKKENIDNDKRTAEFVLGLLGGIFGITAGIFSILYGAIGQAFHAAGMGIFGSLGISAIAFSSFGLMGAVFSRTNGKMGGLFMLFACIGGVISVSAFYILPGILLALPSIMGLIKKNQNNK